MSERLCIRCGNTFPLDKQHFKWIACEERFSGTCLVCRSQQLKAKKEREKQKRHDSMRRIEDAGVDLLLGAATKGGANIPHSAEVIERVFQYFGGVAGFSAVVVKQYWDSAPGGSARNRLIETLCRLVTKNVDSGGAKKPLSLWTEEELEGELNKRFEEALGSLKGTVINVKAEDPRRLTSQAEEAPNCDAAADTDRTDPDAVPAGQPQGHPKRTARKARRSPKALPPDSPAGGSPQVQGE